MFLASQHVLFTLLMGYLNSFIPSLTDLEKNRIQRPRLDNVLYLCVRVELSRIQLFATPWSVAGQAPLSMEFSRQDTGVGCMPFSRDLPNPGIEPRFLTLQADSLLSEPPGKPKNTEVGSLFLLRGIFPTNNQTGVSCIAGRFFTS